MEHDWLNLSETADILGVHPATVRSWADQGKLPNRRTPGGHRRFARADVESYALAQNQQQNTAVQLVIQNMLGRARMEMHSGKLGSEDWYQQLSEAAKHQHSEIGRQLLLFVIRYLTSTEDEDLITDLRQIGHNYEQLGRENGLPLSQTIRAYLFFREILSEAIYDMIATSGTHSPTDWGDIRRRIEWVTNEILIALIEAHEQHIL